MAATPGRLQPPDRQYYLETIDSLLTSTHNAVQVGGKVVGIVTREDWILSFRIVDGHGHSLACVLPAGGQQPRVGVAVIVSGQRKVFTPPFRPTVVEIDPVETVVPVE